MQNYYKMKDLMIFCSHYQSIINIKILWFYCKWLQKNFMYGFRPFDLYIIVQKSIMRADD